jgi:hypothetical protein
MNSELANKVFDFFMTATKEDIKNLGWRLGEKNDSFTSKEDFEIEYIMPLLEGMQEGNGFND